MTNIVAGFGTQYGTSRNARLVYVQPPRDVQEARAWALLPSLPSLPPLRQPELELEPEPAHAPGEWVWEGADAATGFAFTAAQRAQTLQRYVAGERAPYIPTGFTHLLRDGYCLRHQRGMQLWAGRLHDENATLVVMTAADLVDEALPYLYPEPDPETDPETETSA